ncbi:MAG: methyltransferase domain-containing protein [Phycisphaeraceae bacterium]
MPDLSRRILTPELMDRDDVPPAQLADALAFIRWVNRRLRGSDAVLTHLRQWAHAWPSTHDQPITILDLATGSADIPIAIAQWAQSTGHHVHITGLDRHAATLALAQRHLDQHPAARGRIRLVRGDALRPPFASDSFDYVIASLFLHHLSDIEVLTALRIMDRLARRGIIWNDLLRHHRAYWWIKLLTLRSSPMIRHDARVSVLAGFRRAEVLDFRDRLDLHHTSFHRHFAHRFTLAGQR